MAHLLAAADPESLVDSWARPWNADGRRVRLDNAPRDGTIDYWTETEAAIGAQMKDGRL